MRFETRLRKRGGSEVTATFPNVAGCRHRRVGVSRGKAHVSWPAGYHRHSGSARIHSLTISSWLLDYALAMQTENSGFSPVFHPKSGRKFLRMGRPTREQRIYMTAVMIARTSRRFSRKAPADDGRSGE